MATRRYGLKPEQASFQITEAVGAVTVTNPIEVTVDFDALVAYSPTMTGPLAKMMVIQALEKVITYIEQQHLWPPA